LSIASHEFMKLVPSIMLFAVEIWR